MKIFFLLFLCFPIICCSQKQLQTISLSDSGNILNSIYLKELDSVFKESRLIGMGESTHGTSEFTLIRTDIFKYLVEKHNYSVFFLEADYNACSRVNRFIHGANDEAKEALLEVRLWPWMTEELLDFIGWMRTYNMTHDNVLEFVGCDMQLIVDDKIELTRIFSNNKKFFEFESKLPNLDFDVKNLEIVNEKHKEWIEFSNNFYEAFPEEEVLMINTVSQWFKNATSKNHRVSFRDSCMGNNIAFYLNKNPHLKGMYFAHNGHVGNISYKLNDIDDKMKRAGHFLKEQFADKYYIIAMDFNTGSFNAINYYNQEYFMEYFIIKKRDRKSLSYFVLRNDDKIKFVKAKDIPLKKQLKINFIGAIYGNSINGNKIYRYRKLESCDYDGFILVNKTTPTNLLKMKPTKAKKYVD